jgi:hypothetical protein
MSATQTVRAEPVEALSSSCGHEEGKGFDELSPNGLRVTPVGESNA